MTTQQQTQTVTITATIPETTPIQPQYAISPPTKVDLLIDIITEREQLKTLREELKAGSRRVSKTLQLELYLTQIILSADKIALYAIKENILTVNNNTQIDITNQTNELIKISREAECKPLALSTPS
jgi:hypothetical protein